MGWIVTPDGDRMIFNVLGGDPVVPDRTMPCYLEVMPGGKVVARAATNPDRVTVAPDPIVPPTVEEVDE